MMKVSFLIALILYGSISNNYGRIGVLVSRLGCVNKVYKISPANAAGIKKGDRIIECDGVEGTKLVDGIEGTTADITIIRNGTTLKFQIVRERKELVHD